MNRCWLQSMTLSTLIGVTTGCSNSHDQSQQDKQPLPSATHSVTPPLANSTRSPATGRYEVTITRSEYGDAWPFTVESGVLAGKPTGRRLSDGTELAAVTFATGGQTYAINGTARGTHRYAEPDHIWASDSKLPPDLSLKKNLGPIINRGLKLASGIDEPFVAAKPAPLPIAGVSGQIRCDRFDVAATLDPDRNDSTRRARISIKTDLPGSTNIMVSVSRIFLNTANNKEYSINYFEEKSTVAEWLSGKVIELDQEKWQAKLDAKQAILRRLGEGFSITGLDSAATVSFIVPVNQSDKRFGPRNENLVGAEVEDSDGLRIVRRESRLEWPVAAQ